MITFILLLTILWLPVATALVSGGVFVADALNIADYIGTMILARTLNLALAIEVRLDSKVWRKDHVVRDLRFFNTAILDGILDVMAFLIAYGLSFTGAGLLGLLLVVVNRYFLIPLAQWRWPELYGFNAKVLGNSRSQTPADTAEAATPSAMGVTESGS